MSKDKETRPTVTNPPGGMGKPPGAVGPETEGKDTRPPVEMTISESPSPMPTEVKELPEGAGEPADLLDARNRAKESGGNVFLVNKTLVTGQKGHVTESDFAPGTDFDWLIKQGAISPVGNLKAHPRMATALGKDGLEEIDRLQSRNNELQADNDRLQEEITKLKGEVDKLKR